MSKLFRENETVGFDSLKGKIITKIDDAKKHSDEILFHTDDGERYVMGHRQDCCEDVYIESIDGDIEDLLNTPILMAEMVQNEPNTNPEGVDIPDYQDSFTWTFYKIATIKGRVTIRWYGESNGYYSEEVSFERVVEVDYSDEEKEERQKEFEKYVGIQPMTRDTGKIFGLELPSIFGDEK